MRVARSCAAAVSSACGNQDQEVITIDAQDALFRLGAALAIGLLIGIERGFREREAPEGRRVAGLRTFGLIGLFGGVAALLAERLGALALGFGFLALAAVLVTAYLGKQKRSEDVGITSLVAALLVFVLGALCVAGNVLSAGSAAVATALILNYKPGLHRFVSVLSQRELDAGLQLLLISVVLLPVLPDEGYGPWQALNPYIIWWMVVLIALLSFAGYVAVRLGGVERGVVFTGLLGGLASSTAVTLHLSRAARDEQGLERTLAAGTLLACGTMLPRMLLVATVVNPALLKSLLAPALAMAVIVYAPAIAYARTPVARDFELRGSLKNPLDLRSALGFGALLAAIMLAGRALEEWTGDAGLLALAATSGISDVDAITLSFAQMSAQADTGGVFVAGIVLAAAVNSVTKAAMSFFIGGRAIGLRVGLPLVAAAATGLLIALL